MLYVPSFFCKATYRIKKLTGATSNALFAMESLFDTGADRNLINKDSLPAGSKESVVSIQLLQLWMATQEIVSIQGVVPRLVCIWEWHVRFWIRAVEIFAVEVWLGTSFIDWRICRIFQTELKAVRCPAKPVAIISSKKSINWIYASLTVFREYTKLLDDAVREDTDFDSRFVPKYQCLCTCRVPY